MIYINIFYTMLRMQLLRRNAPFAALAFAISLALLPLQYFPTGDGVLYAKVGQNIWAGYGIASFPGEPYVNHQPFYPFLLGFLNLLIRNPELSGHLVSALAFALTVFPLMAIARNLYGETAARWSGFLYATNGLLLIYSNLMIADFVLLFLVVSEVFCIQRILRDGATVGHGLMLGMLGGLAYLTRPEGFLYYAVGLFCILRRPYIAAASLLSFSALSLPYLAFVYSVTHKIQLSGMAGVHVIRRQLVLAHPDNYRDVLKVYEGLAADKKTMGMDRLASTFNMLEYLRADAYALLKSIPASAMARLRGLSQYLFEGLGFVFLGISWFSAPWSTQRKQSEAVLFLFLLPFFPYLLLQFVPRYYLTIFPFLLLWMGHGVAVLQQRIAKGFSLLRRGNTAVAAALCFFFLSGSGWYISHCLKHAQWPFAHKEMGLWMKTNIPDVEREIISAQDPYASFFSGARPLPLPYVERFDDFLAFMRHQGARFFLVGDDLYAPQSESFRFLLETERFPDGVLLRHRTGGDKRLYLFEVQP